MKIGKVPNEILEKYIFNLDVKNNNVLLSPSMGEDAAVVNIEGDLAVLTCDPITAADKNSGFLSVAIVCNDLAATGAEPIGILSTILLPPNVSEENFKEIIESIRFGCDTFNVSLLGGHSEITESVLKPIIVSTGFGRVKNGKFISSSNAKPNDKIIITKSICLEGCSIIANDKEHILKSFLTEEEILKAKNYIREISVVKEGLIAKEYASAMHDITEGGLFGALYELCTASQVGAIVYEERIKIPDVTMKICNYFNINPYKLISSGSLIITTDCPEPLIEKLNHNGIETQLIGEIIENKDIKFIKSNGEAEKINEAPIDEIYKIL